MGGVEKRKGGKKLIKMVKPYEKWFEKEIPTFYTAKQIQVVTLLETIDPCIFRTDVEGLDVISTVAGIENKDIITRSLIFKRKKVAARRRTGKQLLRKLLENVPSDAKDQCFLNQGLCGRCIDCTLFGYTNPNGQRQSRVHDGVCFSIRPYESIYEVFNWNAIQEDTQAPGQAFGDIEVIKPGVVYPDVSTMQSVTYEEFIYYLWCILNTRRYGAVTSRTGRAKVKPVAILFSDSELVTSLELTQKYYDVLKKEKLLDQIVLSIDVLAKFSDEVIKSLVEENANSHYELLDLANTETFLKDFRRYYVKDTEVFYNLIKELEGRVEKRKK